MPPPALRVETSARPRHDVAERGTLLVFDDVERALERRAGRRTAPAREKIAIWNDRSMKWRASARDR